MCTNLWPILVGWRRVSGWLFIEQIKCINLYEIVYKNNAWLKRQRDVGLRSTLWLEPVFLICRMRHFQFRSSLRGNKMKESLVIDAIMVGEMSARAADKYWFVNGNVHFKSMTSQAIFVALSNIRRSVYRRGKFCSTGRFSRTLCFHNRKRPILVLCEKLPR